MTITYHPELIQGSDEWLAARCGILTATGIEALLTPKLAPAKNEKARAHTYEMLAQRLTRYVEPQFVSDAMLRGLSDEIYARALYSEKYAPVAETGFVTNDKLGFTIGCSPDGLVGDRGGVEIKSRMQKFQVQTIIENEVPTDFMIQIQTNLFVTERDWWDFISWCGGMPMFVKRVEPDPVYFEAIANAAIAMETALEEAAREYRRNLIVGRFHPTERTIEQDIVV